MSGLQHWDLIPTVPFRFPSLEGVWKRKGRPGGCAWAPFVFLEVVMESAFAWLNTLVQTFYRFFPHILIVRATHAGVKWAWGSRIKTLGPGLHVYWPLTTEVEVIVTARQTLTIPDQVLATKDGKKVVVKTLVVYKIRDAEHAIGKSIGTWTRRSTI